MPTRPATCQACQRVADCVVIDGVMLCGDCAAIESRDDKSNEREDAP